MLTLKQAQSLSATAVKLATGRRQAVAVSICDEHGELLHFCRMDTTAYHAGVLAQSKAYTAARDRQPSGDLGAWAQATGKDISYWSDPKITGFKGGLPIVQHGKVIGGIGISGLSEEDDEALTSETLVCLA